MRSREYRRLFGELPGYATHQAGTATACGEAPEPEASAPGAAVAPTPDRQLAITPSRNDASRSDACTACSRIRHMSFALEKPLQSAPATAPARTEPVGPRIASTSGGRSVVASSLTARTAMNRKWDILSHLPDGQTLHIDGQRPGLLGQRRLLGHCAHDVVHGREPSPRASHGPGRLSSTGPRQGLAGRPDDSFATTMSPILSPVARRRKPDRQQPPRRMGVEERQGRFPGVCARRRHSTTAIRRSPSKPPRNVNAPPVYDFTRSPPLEKRRHFQLERADDSDVTVGRIEGIGDVGGGHRRKNPKSKCQNPKS